MCSLFAIFMSITPKIFVKKALIFSHIILVYSYTVAVGNFLT